MNDVYIHQISPFALQFSAHFGLRWYGLSYLAGFLAGYLIICWLSKRRLCQLSLSQVSDFIFWVALGTIIGGRLGYCFFYSPDLLTQVKDTFPFWGVLALNEGGMASHGGIMGIIVACLLYARKNSLSAAHLFDLTTLGGTIGIFFGRMANFINGELVGRVVSTPLSWAVKFPQDILSWPSYEPERLRQPSEVANKLGLGPATWQHLVESYRFSATSSQDLYAALNRIILETQNHNPEILAALAPTLLARHPSQLYEALLEGLLLFLMLAFIWRHPRRPGVIAGCFFVLYAAARIFAEQFRLPDLQIGFQALGLTRGQWLSAVMMLLGGAFLFYAHIRSAPKLGGWLYPKGAT